MSTLANARDVLRLMADRKRPLTVTEVASHLDLPKSSASRTLSMMASYGFLERDPATLAYQPGALIQESALWARQPDATTTELRAALAGLVTETGYTGYLNVLDGSSSLVIHMRLGRGGRLQVYTPEGTRGPAYGTSMGRAMLSRLGDDAIRALVQDDLSQARGSAPRSMAELVERIALIRRRGFAVSRGEFVHNVAGISAAVCDHASGRPIGIGIALPADELGSDADGLGAAVLAAARLAGQRIGDPYWLAFSPPPEVTAEA
ncbi:MAG: IclR family transcriptional regulator [Propioniciclava sp.]